MNFKCDKCDDSGYYVEKDENGIEIARQCICHIKNRIVKNIQKVVPSEYYKKTWDDFKGKYSDLASIAKKHFKVVFKKELKDPDNYITKQISRGKNISIIGNTGSGVSLLGYLILKEIAKKNYIIDSITWSSLLVKIRQILSYNSNSDWDTERDNLVSSDALFIDSIQKEFIEKVNDGLVFLNEIIESRHKENKMTIFGMNFLPNATIYGELFYKNVLHGELCTRIFLSPINMVTRDIKPDDIDKIGIHSVESIKSVTGKTYEGNDIDDILDSQQHRNETEKEVKKKYESNVKTINDNGTVEIETKGKEKDPQNKSEGNNKENVEMITENSQEEKAQESAANDNTAAPVKRGRGRPRKVQDGTTAPVAPVDENAPKRGRGRPPKPKDENAPAAPADSTPKRGRGRPRKNP